MEIDHFIPQNERPDLVYTWENLYPVDQKANKQRLKKTPDGGYLDPCDPADDVENQLIYVVEFGGNALFKARDTLNLKAVNTAILLNRVHKDLKPAIEHKHHKVVDAIARWNTAKVIGDVARELDEELLLSKLLSRDSHFTMLMRSIWAVANHQQLIKLFD